MLSLVYSEAYSNTFAIRHVMTKIADYDRNMCSIICGKLFSLFRKTKLEVKIFTYAIFDDIYFYIFCYV
jgi:hypothetical protein